MKKLLSLALSMCMILSCFVLPVSASAEDGNKLDDRMRTCAEYLLKDVKTLTVGSASDFVTYLRSGYDMSPYTDGFVSSISEMLNQNDGKLTEDLGIYGAVILSLRALGYDPANFNGVDLVAQFESISTDKISSPYYYRLAIEAADEAFAIKLCDRFIADYYTMGEGMNYWGYSCDNTAALLAAIAGYKEQYSDVVTDACSVIAKNTNDNGCCYDLTYTDTSPDSTAMALMAYSAIGEMDLASYMYNSLVSEFEGPSGAIQYYGEDNAYSTKSALIGYGYYRPALQESGYEHSMTLEKSDVLPCVAGTRYLTCSHCDRRVNYAYSARAPHSYSTVVKTTAKVSREGKLAEECAVCGDVRSTTPIAKIKSLSLSTTVYIYNGKVKRPAVTVKDSNGEVISSDYYTLTYSNGRKNVGKYQVTVKFKDRYTGTKYLYFRIVPKATSINDIDAKKGGFIVKWNKITPQASGYQIQYSTSSKFTSPKTYKITNPATTSKRVTGLESGEKYYVRVRAYKTVDGQRYFSTWSKSKAVIAK